MLAFSRADWAFPPFLWGHIGDVLGIFVLAWLVTCGVLALFFRWGKVRWRERARHHDQILRSKAHHLRFGSQEHDDVSLRRERVWLSWFFRFWTNFASAPVLSIGSLLVPFMAFRHSMASGVFDRTYAATWLLPGLCYAGAMLLSFVLKRVFRRQRPPLQKGDFGYKLTKDPSFPSGHSLTSFCFWAMIPVAAHLTAWRPNTVLQLALLSVAIVLLTGFSRIYLRVHFPSDVAGGFVIGALWTGVCLMLLPNALNLN